MRGSHGSIADGFRTTDTMAPVIAARAAAGYLSRQHMERPASFLRHFFFPIAIGTLFWLSACGGESSALDPSPDGAAGSDATTDPSTGNGQRFSFFVTSLLALQELSGNPNGFGGDLRFGQADGLSGADEICRQISLRSMPSNTRTWRAFLSVTEGQDGSPVHAIDRVGEGPWYDRVGRVIAMNKVDLAQERPRGADPAIANDLPNEDGVPNHNPDGSGNVDNHDMLTGTGASGMLQTMDWTSTCHDWTSSVGSDGRPRCGHSWPRGGGGGGGGGGPGFDGGIPPGIDGGFRPGIDGGLPPMLDGGINGDNLNNWMSALAEAGCAPGVNLIETGPPDPSNPTVGSGGGYGGFYCFALSL